MVIRSAKQRAATQSRAFEYLDRMYGQILRHATGGQPSEVLQTIISAIVLAFGRLSARELGVLLQMEGEIRPALADLRSIILVPDGDGPIRVYHRSFRDFITDNARCTDTNLFIDGPLRHAEMARSCLERMSSAHNQTRNGTYAYGNKISTRPSLHNKP